MRSSDWQITWDPAGASPLVLLDYDDLMDSEIRLPREQLSAAGKSDFALRVVPLARQNAKARLEFTRRVAHATAAGSWDASLAALGQVPWGMKGVLRVQPRGGAGRDYTAAVLSSSHRPSYQDGIIESVHGYALRVVALPVPLPLPVEGLVVTGALSGFEPVSDVWSPVTFPFLPRLSFLHNDRPCYGDPELSTACLWETDSWILYTVLANGTAPLWDSSDDVPTPDLCSTWAPTEGASGIPTVTFSA